MDSMLPKKLLRNDFGGIIFVLVAKSREDGRFPAVSPNKDRAACLSSYLSTSR